jgi:hypothetical protein
MAAKAAVSLVTLSSPFTPSIRHFFPTFCLHPRGLDWLLMTVMPACPLALYDLYLSDNRRRPFCSIPHCLLPCITSFSCLQSYRFASLSTAVSPLAFICFSLLTSTQNLFVRIRRAFTSPIAYFFAHRILLILLTRALDLFVVTCISGNIIRLCRGVQGILPTRTRFSKRALSVPPLGSNPGHDIFLFSGDITFRNASGLYLRGGIDKAFTCARHGQQEISGRSYTQAGRKPRSPE